MKKDIPVHKVEDIAVCIVPRTDDPFTEDLWDVYLINLKETSIHNVLVNSRGYGMRSGERVETATFRYFYEEIGPLYAAMIEPVQVALSDITHEYWISFTVEGEYMYDKRFVFVSGSMDKQFFTRIPFLDRPGVMIR